MTDDQKVFGFFEALAHQGEPDEHSLVAKWRSFVDSAIKHLMKKTAEIETHLKKLDQPVGIGHTVVEIAIAKLEPGPDDVVVFWLPAELTHAQVRSVGDSFRAVIGGRFRFLVLIRRSVEIEIIGGKISKGGVILPS